MLAHSKTQIYQLKCKSESVHTTKNNGIIKTQTIWSKDGYRSAIAISKDPAKHIYFEAQISSDQGFARIGFANKNAEINGPIGMDSNGYSIGSKNGYGFHNGKRIRFADRFGKEDVISCLLEEKKGSRVIKFFINGNPILKSFQVANETEPLWPSFSVCRNCTLTINFGSLFSYHDKIMGLEN